MCILKYDYLKPHRLWGLHLTCLNQITQPQNVPGIPVVVAGMAEGIPQSWAVEPSIPNIMVTSLDEKPGFKEKLSSHSDM